MYCMYGILYIYLVWNSMAEMSEGAWGFRECGIEE